MLYITVFGVYFDVRFIKFIFSRLFFCISFIAVIFAAIIFLCLYLHSLLPAALGVAVAYALSLACALFLFCRDGRNDYKCAWLALIAALPVVGVLLYAFSCTGTPKRNDNPPPPPLTTYDECEYFKDGARYLSRLRACVAEAKSEVFLEYYIISKGQIWGLLCKELEKALGRGVCVKIIYDGLGSAMHAPKKDFKRLVKCGATIKVFNKLLPFPVSRLNCRNHRKIAAIDGNTVFLGGVNIADEYANINSPHGYWKDGGIMMRGSVAARYRDVFLADFSKDNGAPQSDNDDALKQAESGDIHAKAVRIVADEPANVNGICEELVTAKIYSASERVCIFTPYLCVGEKLKDALLFAAGRGARVQIIIPEVPDKRLTFEITLTFASELAAHGIEVYRYKPGFMHAKCILCDDEVLLGSYNFDYRSMRLNYECGVWVSGELVQNAVDDFKESLIISSRMDGRNVSLMRRAVRGTLKLFSPLV